MTVANLAIIAGLVFAWGTLSARLESFDMTAPIVFTVAGVLLTHGPLAPLGITPSREVVKVLAEVTLALVLFSDASRVGLRQLRADLGLCLRLLCIGLPLTIGLGTLVAFTLPGVNTIWLALLVGAALAPTDAALGAAVMVNRAVPARIRRLLNVESGLNDGIATPFVLVALAGAATAEHTASTGPGSAVAELALGLLIGERSAVAAAGWSGWAVTAAGWRRGLPAPRCWAWRCAATPPLWRCMATGSSPRSPAAWLSLPPAARRRSWSRSWKRPAPCCRCWSG